MRSCRNVLHYIESEGAQPKLNSETDAAYCIKEHLICNIDHMRRRASRLQLLLHGLNWF